MEYFCKVCKKKYASYKSLWFHNNKYHITKSIPECAPEKIPLPNCDQTLVTNSSNSCSICSKLLSNRHSRWRHEQTCKTKNINELELMKKEMEKLKAMLQKSLKIHPNTLNKINNQLNNSGTINNITIIQLGSENLSEILNNKEKKYILDRQAMSINHLVDLIHVSGKYKKFQNVYITNLQSTFAYKFDEKQNKFIAVNKNELITDIVDSRMYDIQKFYDEIYPELEPKKAEQIKKFIDRMGNEEDELKDVKKEEIKLILYNNREKVLQKEEALILIDDKNIEI